MNIKNLIFDVDGTLWNTTPTVAKAWTQAYSQVTGTPRELKPKDLQKYFGKTMTTIAKELFPECSLETQQRLIEVCCELEHVAIEEATPNFYPEVLTTLDNLAKEYKLFIVSNAQSGYIELVIKKGHLEAIISDYLSFGDTGFGKDYNIAEVIKRNNLIPNETLYLGDIQADQDASHAAGIKMIFCAYGFGSVAKPDYSINRMGELPALLTELNHK